MSTNQNGVMSFDPRRGSTLKRLVRTIDEFGGTSQFDCMTLPVLLVVHNRKGSREAPLPFVRRNDVAIDVYSTEQ